MRNKPIVYIQGGGVRGLYPTGFLTALMEHKGVRLSTTVDHIRGVSAGAIAGYLVGLDDPRAGVNELLDATEGLIKELIMGKRERLNEALSTVLNGENLNENGPGLQVGITRIDGSLEYHTATRKNVTDLLLGTISIPGILGPHPIKDLDCDRESLKRFKSEQQILAYDGGLNEDAPGSAWRLMQEDPKARLLAMMTRDPKEKGWTVWAMAQALKLSPTRSLGKALQHCFDEYFDIMGGVRSSRRALVVEPETTLGAIFAPKKTCWKIFDRGFKAGAEKKGDEVARFLTQ